MLVSLTLRCLMKRVECESKSRPQHLFRQDNSPWMMTRPSEDAVERCILTSNPTCFSNCTFVDLMAAGISVVGDCALVDGCRGCSENGASSTGCAEKSSQKGNLSSEYKISIRPWHSLRAAQVIIIVVSLGQTHAQWKEAGWHAEGGRRVDRQALGRRSDSVTRPRMRVNSRHTRRKEFLDSVYAWRSEVIQVCIRESSDHDIGIYYQGFKLEGNTGMWLSELLFNSNLAMTEGSLAFLLPTFFIFKSSSTQRKLKMFTTTWSSLTFSKWEVFVLLEEQE